MQLPAWCVSIVKRLPIIFAVVTTILTYYAYVYQICSLNVTNSVGKVLYLIGYHILFVFTMWAYWEIIFAEIARVPEKFKMPRAELQKLEEDETAEAEREILERFAQDLPITNRTKTGSIRYCEICQHIKPDRAHHCRRCGECVLKMDHHCIWFNRCVSFTNYKIFLLLLGYNLLYCLFIELTTLSILIECVDSDGKAVGCFQVILLFVSASIFLLGLLCVLGCHCYLVLKNKTTIESFRAPIFRTGEDSDGFNLGKYKNFQEVFGDNKIMWFLPIFTSLGDGSSFAVRAKHQLSANNSMNKVQTSLDYGKIVP
jgi:palmitoyltransferase